MLNCEIILHSRCYQKPESISKLSPDLINSENNFNEIADIKYFS